MFVWRYADMIYCWLIGLSAVLVRCCQTLAPLEICSIPPALAQAILERTYYICHLLVTFYSVCSSLEYTAPESLPSPQTGLVQQVDSKADMWSLGMILHKLLFFRLPYRYASDGDADTNRGNASAVDEADTMDRLEKEVLRYTGLAFACT